MAFDVISLGELLVEFVRKERDGVHTTPGTYLGPYPSGAPAITIDSCARLGLKTGFIGVVGNDDFGQLLIKRLASDGVDVSKIYIDENSMTGMAFVAYRVDGSRRFVFNLKFSASAKLSPDHIEVDYVGKSKVLHISGSTIFISKSSKEACEKAVTIAKQNNVLVTLDPNLRPELASLEESREALSFFISKSDVILVGEDELLKLFDTQYLNEAIQKLFDRGPKIVVVKRGKRGSMMVTRSGDVVEASAFTVKEVDPTGAGDVYNAAFIYGYLKGWGYRDILIFANAAGAVKVMKVGPMEGPESIDEISKIIREFKV